MCGTIYCNHGVTRRGALKAAVPLVMVLGHSNCGAIGAAIKVVEDNAELLGQLPGLVQSINPAVDAAKAKSPHDLLAAAITENVERETARNSATLASEFRANQTGEDRWRGL